MNKNPNKENEEKISIENFQTETKLLEYKGITDEKERYVQILNNATSELKKLIISKELKDFKSLTKEIEIISKEKLDVDAILLLGCTMREYSENIDNFLERRIKELVETGARERTIVKILANTIWPGNEKARMKLKEAESLDYLKVLIKEEINRLRNKETVKPRKNYPRPKEE